MPQQQIAPDGRPYTPHRPVTMIVRNNIARGLSFFPGQKVRSIGRRPDGLHAIKTKEGVKFLAELFLDSC